MKQPKQPKKPRAAATPKPELPRLAFASARAFSTWLSRHHAKEPGIWLEFGKAGSGIESVTYAEAVEVALCWGWIDGQARGLDEKRYLQRFTPRGKRSLWSKINCARATALVEAGRMQAPGLAEIERARQDGRWEQAYDPPSKATVPDDLAAALAREPRAAATFAGLNASNRYSVLHRVATALTPETRARRVAALVAKLARGEAI